MEDIHDLKENIYTKECLVCGQLFVGVGKEWFGLCPKCKEEKKDKIPQKQCLYCAKYYLDETKEDGTYKYFGVCPDCKIKPTLGCYCGNCGCKISLKQSLSNLNNLCEDCLAEEEDEEEERGWR